MVATRRSLGGHPSPAAPPPPTAAATAPAQLSRAQQAALKKLNIAGTDALKGDTKAAQAAKEAVQTYHYRGAVYAADANTPSSWIENQPKRYLKRSRASSSDVGEAGEGSIAVSEEREEEDDDEEEEEEEEIRRPAKKKSRHSMPHQGRNHKPVASQTPTSSRGKARALRGGRQSLPAKRKAAAIDDNNDNDDSSMNEFDYAISGGPDERICLPRTPNWLAESDPARRDRLSHRVNAVPSTKSPIPNRRAINDDIQRRKEGAARKNYQVEALGDDDIMSEKDLARVALVKLARKQRQLNEKLIEWRMAKELLEAKKREAELKAAMPDIIETAPEQPMDQPAIDQTQSNKVNEDEIDEQWEREQEQNRARKKSKSQYTEPDIQETRQFADPEIPYLSNATYHPFTKAGASRPSTPLQTPLTGPNALPHSSKHGYTVQPAPPQPNPPATPTSDSKKQNQTNASPPRHSTDVDFTTLPPNAPLPTHSAGGDPMRWTIQRRMSVDQTTGEERAEYAIDIARLEGESKSAKIRRVKREKAVVERWGLVDGTGWVEVEGGGGAGE